MKKILSFLNLSLLLSIPCSSLAQIEQEFEENFNGAFELFKQKNTNEFKEFRDKTNQQFSELLKRDWEKFSSEEPQERPIRPEPEKPPVAKPSDEKTVPQELEVEKDIPFIEKTDETPTDIPGIEPVAPSQDTTGKISFMFYGQTYNISPLPEISFTLNSLNEIEIAEAWSKFAALPYEKTVNECIGIHHSLQLNDWGYFLLCGEVARQLLGKKEGDEIAFFQTFLLCQSGYDAKIARSENGLLLLAPSSVMIYGYPFLDMDDKKYYILNKKIPGSMAIYTYRQNFSLASKPMDMYIKDILRLSEKTTVSEKRIGNTENTIAVPVNQALIDFYRNYPQCDFPVYMHAPVDNHTTEALLPPLQKYIEGKTKTEAANLLLNFVQTSFEYQTDPEQFGYEKPFFIEETFFYPYCDCEDRAILYAYLVRTLLDLKVVLLNYPNHIATAVHFTEPVSGDYIKIENQIYTICDPTYINASIGKAMPQCKTATAQVIPY